MIEGESDEPACPVTHGKNYVSLGYSYSRSQMPIIPQDYLHHNN